MPDGHVFQAEMHETAWGWLSGRESFRKLLVMARYGRHSRVPFRSLSSVSMCSRQMPHHEASKSSRVFEVELQRAVELVENSGETGAEDLAAIARNSIALSGYGTVAASCLEAQQQLPDISKLNRLELNPLSGVEFKPTWTDVCTSCRTSG
jgi:hypothetical protein